MDITHDPITAGMVKKLIDTPAGGVPIGGTATFASASAEITLPDGTVWIKAGYADFDVASYPELAAAGGLGVSPTGVNICGLDTSLLSGVLCSSRLSDGRIIAITLAFDVLRSDVTGSNWEIIAKYPSLYSEYYLYPAKLSYVGGILFASSDNGELARSADDGVTWTKCTGLYASSVYEVMGAGAFLLAYSRTSHGYRYRSYDNGVTWAEMPLISGTRAESSNIVLCDDNSLVMSVPTYGVMRFPEGASVWTQVLGTVAGDVAKTGTGTLIACGASGAISTSANHGVTWTTRTARGSSQLGYKGTMPSGKAIFSYSGGRTSSLDGITWSTISGPTEFRALTPDLTIGTTSNGLWAYSGSTDTVVNMQTPVNWASSPYPSEGDFAPGSVALLPNNELLWGNTSNGTLFAVKISPSGYSRVVAGKPTHERYPLAGATGASNNFVRAPNGDLYAIVLYRTVGSSYARGLALAKSVDNGATWTRQVIPMGEYIHSNYANIGVLSNNTVVVILLSGSSAYLFTAAGEVTLPSSKASGGAVISFDPYTKEIFYVNSSLKLVRTTDLVTWETSVATLPNMDNVSHAGWGILKMADGSYLMGDTAAGTMRKLASFTAPSTTRMSAMNSPNQSSWSSSSWATDQDGWLYRRGTYSNKAGTSITTGVSRWDRHGNTFHQETAFYPHVHGVITDSNGGVYTTAGKTGATWFYTKDGKTVDTGVIGQTQLDSFSNDRPRPEYLGNGVYGTRGAYQTPVLSISAQSAGSASLPSGTHVRVK